MAGGNVDPALRVLGGRGRYQLLQLFFINLGAWGAAFQLFDNIFTGRKVTWHRCSPPRSWADRRRAAILHGGFNGTSEGHVTYGPCQITVHKDHGEVATYPCLFGYDYDYPRELSFRTEFDLVCEHALLADLLQTLVIVGQGCGAVVSSLLADRYGRKRVLVHSQFGLLGVGLAIGLAPTYASLAFLKFLVGCIQQGVVTGKATMSIELFPSERRSLMMVAMAVMWVTGNTLLALAAFLMRHHGWRALQCLLSAVSALGLLQLGYLDESLRWLVANGRRAAAERVLRRAARVNRKDVNAVLNALYGNSGDTAVNIDSPADQNTTVTSLDQDSTKTESQMDDFRQRSRTVDEEWELLPGGSVGETNVPFPASSDQFETSITMRSKRVQSKLTVCDFFTHRRLRFNTLVIWTTWFTCAFCNFTLYMMSSSLHGDRFLNFVLIVLMELPACLLFYCTVDRVGRKPTIQLFIILSAAGILSSGFFRVFEESWLFGVLSVVTAMLAMMGATGVFGAMFFYTPEVYPTNVRQQALGFASSFGRLGGMIAPFMVPLSEVIVWLPGAITGILCLIVIFLFRFLPETQGRELPQTLQDLESWDSGENGSRRSACDVACADELCGTWARVGKAVVRSCRVMHCDSPQASSAEKNRGGKGCAAL